MALLSMITPNWLIRMSKGLSSTKDSRREHYCAQINDLRALLWMLHDHNTRYVRCPQSPQASTAREEIRVFCGELLKGCHHSQRPLFRVLQSRMEQVLSSLPNQSKPGWYAIHHRASDHLIYIIDEVTRSYLSENTLDASYDEYQAFWQTWIDTKEAQLRFEQAVMRLMEGKTAAWQSVNLQSRILQKRMHQVSLMSSGEATLAFDRVDNRFDSVIRAVEEEIPASSLLKISQDLSVILLHLFDRELILRTTETQPALSTSQPEAAKALPMKTG
ncbi:hypothetical protein [Grimontia hollisae]|uniref:hypothetical protein n=1 Tax=Grimontia hollisae TaxID=673 RepID=UPI000DFCA26D|nr:hypothetical protein [Grimontia hollisae]MDF2185815.1 hypothetical protein [Grimontia hollisae]STQ76468.1 Uncharacterised protein [Grimontia hollisae]